MRSTKTLSRQRDSADKNEPSLGAHVWRYALSRCGRKSALNSRWFILLTVLRRWSRCFPILCCFVVYSSRRFVLSLALCYSVLVFFSPFSIVITSLGEERAILVLFVVFLDLCLFGFVCFLFLFLSWMGYGLLLWHSLYFSLTVFVIVALPGLFSYLFYMPMTENVTLIHIRTQFSWSFIYYILSFDLIIYK